MAGQDLTPPRILLSGDAALTVEFSSKIDPAANRRVLALDRALSEERLDGIRETVPTYRSLLVHYDPVTANYDDICQRVLELAKRPAPDIPPGRHWRIPVVYGGEYGIDLEDVARGHDMTPDDVVRRHTSGNYHVVMLGFMPGWAYLTGLDPALATPRRQNPRTFTPAGTISIGGVQAGVQCLAAPSGWHLLGRTPARTYDIQRQPIFMLEPADLVSFYAIPESDFADMSRAAEAGELVAEQVA